MVSTSVASISVFFTAGFSWGELQLINTAKARRVRKADSLVIFKFWLKLIISM
jgi:hypothetical protein